MQARASMEMYAGRKLMHAGRVKSRSLFAICTVRQRHPYNEMLVVRVTHTILYATEM